MSDSQGLDDPLHNLDLDARLWAVNVAKPSTRLRIIELRLGMIEHCCALDQSWGELLSRPFGFQAQATSCSWLSYHKYLLLNTPKCVIHIYSLKHKAFVMSCVECRPQRAFCCSQLTLHNLVDSVV